MQNTGMNGRDWTILLVLSVLWGGSFFFLAIALRELPPITIMLCRVFLGALPLLVVLKLKNQKLPASPRIWGMFLILGLLNNALPFVLYAFAQLRIASGLASILNATTPLWGVLVAHLFTRDERATPAKIIGVLLGFGGVAAMIGTGAHMGGEALAILMCLGATLSYAFAAVYARRFRPLGIPPLTVATGQLLGASLLLLPFSLALERPWSIAPPHAVTWAAIAGFALICTSFAYWLYFRLLESSGATNALLVTFLIPVTAILLGALVLGEALEPRHYAGMALIALGLAAIDGRPLRRLVPRAAVP
ncbi:DMT family transporter [Sphingomonas tabacisoli]|uniref:DMT family transporter n=1 Tax=Sphingomonas tabacisoli TaxID=2249466 RepID=A0ABW4I3L8_9SPHN